MNVTKDERRNRKRFLIIIILTLLICISGMFGVAYSALISDVRNDANVIAAEGIDARIVDDNGELLKEGDFAKNANDGAGANKLGYGSTSTNDELFGYRIGEQTLELGKAELIIKANNSNTQSVKISYKVTWDVINPESEYGMTTKLKIGTGVDAILISQDSGSGNINIILNPKNTFTLIGEISGEAKTVDDEPGIMKYSITIFIQPN